MTQLRQLAEPIPKDYIGKDADGREASDHTVVTQLLHLYAPGWSFEITQVLRSDVPGFKTKNNKIFPGGFYVTGCIGRLTVTIDGTQQVIDEAGGVELAAMKDGDGERLKHAASDALKRCAMRLGLGLHLWAQEHYFLHHALDKRTPRQEDGSRPPAQPKQQKGNGPRPADDSPPFDAKGSIRDDQMADISAGLVGEEAPETLAKILDWAKVERLEDLSATQADKVIMRMAQTKAERDLAEVAEDAA